VRAYYSRRLLLQLFIGSVRNTVDSNWCVLAAFFGMAVFVLSLCLSLHFSGMLLDFRSLFCLLLALVSVAI